VKKGALRIGAGDISTKQNRTEHNRKSNPKEDHSQSAQSNNSIPHNKM